MDLGDISVVQLIGQHILTQKYSTDASYSWVFGTRREERIKEGRCFWDSYFNDGQKGKTSPQGVLMRRALDG